MKVNIKERARRKLLNQLLYRFLNGYFVRASDTEGCYLGEASEEDLPAKCAGVHSARTIRDRQEVTL